MTRPRRYGLLMLRRALFLMPPALVVGLVFTVLPVVNVPPSAPPTPTVATDELVPASQTVGTGWTKTVGEHADMVGVQWKGDRAATFSIEKRDHNGKWSSESVVGVPDGGPDVGSAEARRRPAANVSEPVWVGNATAVRVRVAGHTARAVHLTRIDVPRRVASPNVAEALAPAPWIIPRSQWGADESLRLTNCPNGPDYDQRVDIAIVHHTGGSNAYGPGDSPAIMRGLYAYATQTLQYCDKHYNFLVDRFGQIFEGRFGGITEAVHGAHSIGFNTNSTGIAAIGNFQTTAAPGPMVAAIDALIAWKLGTVHRVDPSTMVGYTTVGNDKFAPGTVLTLPRVIGHRDTWFTDCPGQNLYNLLPAMRADVVNRSSSQWYGWQPLGGGTTSGPASSSWGPNRIDTFARGSNGNLWHQAFAGQWLGWEDIGAPSGGFTGDPAAVSFAPGRIDVFVRGLDDHLWRQAWAGQWYGWEDVGGTLASSPAVSSMSPGRLDVFAKATDGQLQHRYWNGSWSSWEKLGGQLSSDPGAVSWGPNRIDVFVRGTDNQLWHKYFDGTTWSGWEPLGGGLGSGPGVSSWGPNRIDVFVVGTDNQPWHLWYGGSGWHGWEPLGGRSTADPDAVSWSWNRIDVFVRGTDNQLWRRSFT